MKTTQEALQEISGIKGTQQECLNALAFNSAPTGTPLTPLSVKGGVIRNIDQATGDIARTTSGWIEDNKYKVIFASDTSGSGNDYGVFDSANPRTGRLVVKFGNSATTGRCHIDSCEGTGATIPVLYSRDIIKIKPSTAYKITFYSKTVNRTSGSIFQLLQYTGLSRTGNTGYVTISGTTDWTKREVTFTSGATTDGLVLRFQNATGAIEENYIDWNSISLEEVSTITNTSSVPALLYPKATAVTSNDNIDQSQVVKDGSLAFGGSGATDQVAGMLFIPTKKNGTGIVIQRVANTGTYTGDVIISLMGDTGSKPSGTNLITPITIPNATWNALAVDTDYTVSIPYTLTPGSRYYAIFDSSTKDTSNHPNIRCGVAVSGRYYYNGTVWSSVQASYAPYIKTLYSKNTTNFTVRTDTQEVSVTAPTVDGWADGTVIDSADYGVTPLTLAPGVNNIYYSSNGSNLADGETDESLQCIIGGSYGSLGKGLLTRQEACNYWAGTTGLSYQDAMNTKALTTKKTIQEAVNTYLESL